MWCKVCNTETNEKVCPVCGMETVEDIPVFPKERLLLELLLNKEPNEFIKSSVWASNNRYYVDGKVYSISSKTFEEADTDLLIEKLKKYSSENSYEYFEQHIKRFIEANKYRFNYLVNEAGNFIKQVSKNIPEEKIVLSFSGGKDSTATADVVIKALGNPSLVHIFGDTTLEFDTTIQYAERYRENHPQAIFQVARNYDQNFMDVCEDIGPPARMMRWCCSMFKTGPITRVLNSFYRNQQILTFYGIRKAESVSRSKYNRIEDDAESIKIQQQTVASPIFFWKDIDVWLYILTEKIDFNDAYRLGYDRVGCWCCPNNNQRAQFLSRIYIHERSVEWRDFLIKFAKKIGKPDPEVYVDSGKWKAREGRNGLKSASDVKIKFTNCTAEEHSKIYSLVREYSDELVNMFVPFGKLAPKLGRKILREVIVLDVNTNVPIISIQPFNQDDYEYAVKIKTMNVANHNDLQRMIEYQIKKYNACRKCLKCELLCRAGAINIVGDLY